MTRYKIELEVEGIDKDDALLQSMKKLKKLIDGQKSENIKVFEIKPFIVSDDISASGTSLQGYVKTKYAKLVEVFGEPPITDGDKTTVEWDIEFSDGTIATIYDYKCNRTPLGTYAWHVGGNDKHAVELVSKYLDTKAKFD